MNERKNESIQANVVYLKTDKRDFYTFANMADSGYRPHYNQIANVGSALVEAEKIGKNLPDSK